MIKIDVNRINTADTHLKVQVLVFMSKISTFKRFSHEFCVFFFLFCLADNKNNLPKRACNIFSNQQHDDLIAIRKTETNTLM